MSRRKVQVLRNDFSTNLVVEPWISIVVDAGYTLHMVAGGGKGDCTATPFANERTDLPSGFVGAREGTLLEIFEIN